MALPATVIRLEHTPVAAIKPDIPGGRIDVYRRQANRTPVNDLAARTAMLLDIVCVLVACRVHREVADWHF